MPRCFPPQPEFGEGRHGERAVWEALRNALPDEAALFYSRWIIDGAREYEIDLLVAWPGVGLAAIEVKGGHVERDASDRWFSSRGQSSREIPHPLVQASDARHALQRWMSQSGLVAARSRAQHLLALPHMTIPQDHNPADCPRELVIDKDDLSSIDRHVRKAVESGGGHEALSEEALEQLISRFTMQLPTTASLQTLAEEHEQLVQQMTRDQAETMRNLGKFPRLAVVGGAGTGKTWMALEQARRLAKDGKSVALVCYSRGLGQFLQRMVSGWAKKPTYVGLFHDLAVEWGAPEGEGSDYYEQELPNALGRLAADRPEARRFDAVIVDEGQDFGELWWPSLLACLKDPEDGGVYVFVDQAQRVFSRQAEPPIKIPPYSLYENIRNTKRIAQVFGSLGLEQGTYSGLEGPPVRFVHCKTEDAVDRADDAVEQLTDQWSPGQITLLMTKNRHPMQTMTIDSRGWDGYWQEFFEEDEVFYGHVLGFKGLERQVVVLACNGFKDPDRAREMLYVGLSRPRTLLVVVGDLEEIASVGGEGVRKRLTAAEPWAP